MSPSSPDSPDSGYENELTPDGVQSGGGSECVFSWSYNAEEQELDIRFVERGAYRYFGVPWTIPVGLQEAASLGTYFNEEIRGQFSYDRIG